MNLLPNLIYQILYKCIEWINEKSIKIHWDFHKMFKKKTTTTKIALLVWKLLETFENGIFYVSKTFNNQKIKMQQQ